MSASHQVYIRLISPHLKRSIILGGWETVPSMDLLKALFSSCLEWLNWLNHIPAILMLLCQSVLHFDLSGVDLVYLKVRNSKQSILSVPYI